ncbi:thioester reductase domain-containing protein [Clostridium formicaceticum]|uniref:Polyketide synthase PksM n=1 Tax=Clostridium formicaceticum TaxID=1497 RepID=A0AAC9RIY7_9CLOT|nr:thioester reductase domain-containing protein [Clostridium formicaceticum]AOY76263.1 hypothetical protein BJL90_10330 [Clostridium formicaceticum]ARE86647.1 Polyketide synthase PksM [Clostridium formicaceticum]
MNKQLKILYDQIKEKKISLEDALEKIQEYRVQYNKKATNISNFEKEYSIGIKTRKEHKAEPGIIQDIALVHEKTLYQLKCLFGEVTKLSLDRIDPQEPLESYGIDSIMITQLNQKLVSVFGELSKTLFYEYQTLDALTEYFIADYPEKCFQWTGLVTQRESVPEVSSTGSNFDGVNSMLSSLKTEKKTARNLTMTLSSKKVREPIAIIGISGRYPQAKNLEEFWKNLCEGKDCISEIPKERWSIEGFYHPNPQEAVAQGKSYSKWGGFVDEFADFDPLFFNISPREAFNMDPQERLIIESCWQVLEDAGYTREQLTSLYKQRVGVFTGITKTGFALYGPDLWKQGEQIYPTTSFASVANRVSYLLNLKGPSMPIDTMCSASLTAIHEACEHLYHDECEIAIAAGVNLYLHPMSYIQLSTLKMLAADGKCKSFGQGGSGFVPGEGVGAVLLKPLSQAISDQDHIYAVIRGSSINHGGKTNGYTVPNPSAQGELIRAALDKAETDARAVSYIEAHGTGTELGDPIEITGLSGAFRKDTQDTGFCAIGSVKSNIGHLEAAAGIAGLTKIILQMKNQKIVPSLHAKALNPNINFTKTPFVVQQELTEWKRPMIEKNGEKREYPRIAGISSFGAGGSNAHIVIEEYIPKDAKQYPITITPQNPAIIVLSAKNEERLQEQAQQLLKAIQEQQFTDNDLADMAYTLQIGREAMEERLAIIVASIKELEEKLESFVKGQENIEDLYRGQVKRNKETLAVFAMDEEMQETIEKWIQRRKYAKLLDLWVKGLVFDWNKLYNDTKPSRISLPTYPFARERYWIPETKTKSGDSSITTSANAGTIHPLLHQNTSDLSEQRFSSTFTGQEFFLADHRVKGQGVLPRVAYLEMARAAVEQGTGILKESQVGIRLKNIVWSSSITVEDKPFKVNVGLYPEDSGEIVYEIYSQPEEISTDAAIYSQGSAMLSLVEKIPTMDLSALQIQCSEGTLSSDQCYDIFRTMGLNYGLGYQGIEQIYIGSGQVLAKLSMPSSVSNTQNQFVLHPSLLDASLQASIGLRMGADDMRNRISISPVFPVALQELEILGSCTSEMWTLVRYSGGSTAEDKVQRLDIDLCDDQGNIYVRLKGLEIQEDTETMFAFQETKPQSLPTSRIQEDFEMMTFEEVWKEQILPDISSVKIKTMICFLSNSENQQAIVEEMQALHQQTKIIFISQNTTDQKQFQQEYHISRNDRNSYQEVFQSIGEEYGEIDAILYLWAFEDSSCIKDYASIVYILQAIATTKLNIKRFLLAAQFADGLERCYLESWIGFERSLGLLMPNTQVTVILQEIEKEKPEAVMKNWLRKLWAELQVHSAQSVLYQEGKRHVYKVQPTIIQTGDGLLRSGGTYLITGGCGGLGFLFAEYFAKKHPVNLILTGRSPISAEKQSKIKTLEDLGSRVMYIQANVCDPIHMKQGLEQAKESFGGIHGVIHAAGVEGNQSVLEKDIQRFEQVLEPKIKGTLVLDELLYGEELDFICYFSSSSAILGDFGSCDYAIGNRFLMAYAHYRNQEKRNGKTFSINWPLWKDGGMGFGNNENSKMYLKSSGQRFLEAEEGMNMFERILSQNNIQHLILVGQPSRVHRFLGLIEKQSILLNSNISNSSGKGRPAKMKGLSLKKCLERDLKEHVSNLLKISQNNLDRETNLADFGFDSISLTEFSILLTNYYGIEITPALFFGYPTLEKLTQYFLTEHQEIIQVFYAEYAVEKKSPQSLQVTATTSKRQGQKKSRFKVWNTTQGVPEPIAIIGMSGRFPQANTIVELWKNLKYGKNCITEIPTDRWDWREYYEKGKIKSKWGGFLADIDQFDPLFFEISPREAKLMDPKQRLFLEEAWHALEDAGYMEERIKGKSCGVYVGVEEGEYGFLVGDKGQINNNQNATLSARIAYKLDLKGPNLALTAACSSGLVALHQGCQALRQGDCEMALVGGINLMISPMMYIGMSNMDMLSLDGKSYVFDQRANGLVPSEAVAVVLLKPLSKAILDKDHIYGCIKASGVNYNGKSNGLAVPNPLSQAELMNNIYNKYNINPANIQYVLSHSVGSKLGDPIEVQALSNAFNKYTDKKQYCNLGSIKPLIGHTFAASGVVSLISMLMAMKEQTIPALYNYQSSNEYINFKEGPFFLNLENQTWTTENNQPRMGAISTTGISGTNAHAVIEEYLPRQKKAVHIPSKVSPQIVVFSAKSSERLQAAAQQVFDFIELEKELSLSNLAFTLQIGREAFSSRLAIVASDREELLQALEEYLKSAREGKEIQTAVPIFIGNLEEDHSGIKNLLSDKIGETVLQVLLAEKDLEKIALYWTQGGKISWEILHEGEEVCIISLPTYPFAKERYWFSSQQETNHFIIEGEQKINKFSHEEKDVNYNNSEDVLGIVTKFIKEILGLSSSFIINSKKQLKDYGMDSISGIQLLETLMRELKIKLDTRQFFAEFTLQEIIRQIELINRPLPSVSNPEVISILQWEKDKKLPEDFNLNRKDISIKHTSSPAKVFLTGATGLLGGFLCDEILQQTSATVYCLVRDESESSALKRIKNNFKKYNLWKDDYEDRIIPVLGDLTKPELGIEEKLYNELSQSIERIYHCAALVNHLLNYHAMKAHNVDGTLSIIKFAGNIQVKPIHFISSTAVCSQGKLPAHQLETVLEHGKNLESGYAQTKWVSEHHLIQAQEKGIPITIFRCGQITGSSQTADGTAQDTFHNLLKIFSQVEFVPQWDENVMDIAPIDYVSRAILAISQQNNCYGKIYHLSNPNPIPVQTFFACLLKKNPTILKKVSFEEWADSCLRYINNLPNDSIKTLLRLFFLKDDFGNRVFKDYFCTMNLSNSNTREALQNTSVQFPEIDEKWWYKCLDQLELFDTIGRCH